MAIDPTSLRIAVYDEILNSGRIPTAVMLAQTLGASASEVQSALAALRIGKTILVHPSTGEIWMAGPFSALETAYPVVSGDRAWWANCAWDMFGVAMIASVRATIETRCADCDAPMTIVADRAAPPNDDAVVHFLLPARRWYDDIGFT
jgi:hypothetical protein